MDVVVKASGVGVLDELLEEAVLAGRRPGQAVVFWDVDAPATLARVRRDPADAFLRLIAHYDLILTYGGGGPVSVAYRELGARQCVSIYNGVDPETHHPVPRDPRFEGLLAFLGNRLPDRETRVHEFFFNVARALPHERFLLGGNGWDRNRPALPNVVAFGHVYTADHNAFNVTPRVVLSVNRESMAHVGYSPATRIFEAAGAGACLITDAWDGLESFLEPGREWLVARSGEEVMAHLRDLTPARAQEIGRRARARVLAEHTYEARAKRSRCCSARWNVPAGTIYHPAGKALLRRRRHGIALPHGNDRSTTEAQAAGVTVQLAGCTDRGDGGVGRRNESFGM